MISSGNIWTFSLSSNVNLHFLWYNYIIGGKYEYKRKYK